MKDFATDLEYGADQGLCRTHRPRPNVSFMS